MRVFFIMVLVLMVGLCEFSVPKDRATGEIANNMTDNELTDDDYAIYSCVIKNLKDFDRQKLLISSQTKFGDVKPKSTLDDVSNAIRELGSKIVDESIMKDYKNKNVTTSKLDAKFDLQREYEMSSLPPGEIPDKPAVKMTFSRVGIDAKRVRAIVYYELYSNLRSAAGYFITVVKHDGKWNVEESFNIWAT